MAALHQGNAMDTLKYVIKRLLLAVIILLGVSIIIFGLARMMPTDFVDQQYQSALQQGTMTQDDIDRIKELYGLNMPDAYLTLTLGEGSAFSGETFEKNTKETEYGDIGLGAQSYAKWYSGTYNGNQGRGLKLYDANRVSFKLNGETYICTVESSRELMTPFSAYAFTRDTSDVTTVYGTWNGYDSTRPGKPAAATLSFNNNSATYTVDGVEYTLEDYSLGGALEIGSLELVETTKQQQVYMRDKDGNIIFLFENEQGEQLYLTKEESEDTEQYGALERVMEEVISVNEEFVAQEKGVYYVNVSAGEVPSLSLTIESPSDSQSQGTYPLTTDVAVNYRVANFFNKAGAIFKSYFNWLGKLFQGDLGISFKYKRPVADVIMENMGISFAIAFIATILQFAIAIPLGIKAAVHQYGVIDYTVTIFTMIGISLPTFFLSAIVIRVFALGLGWFEVGGIASGDLPVGAPWIVRIGDNLWHMVLPMFVLVVLSIGSLMRYTRTNTLEALNADYVRTARAKGLSEKTVIYKHAFRNTMVPLVTLLAGVLPSLFGGAMITEQVFSIPGIGKLAYDALVAADVPFIMGYNMFLAVLTVIGMLLSDLLYGVVDPRVKIGK